MVIAFTSINPLPVKNYGGIERVIWDLVGELSKLGHKVYLIAPQGSHCDHAAVLNLSINEDMMNDLPQDIQIIHFHSPPPLNLDLPHVFTLHGNAEFGVPLPLQTVFISQDQANRHNGSLFVHNGLSWPKNSFQNNQLARENFHFLGKASWRRKNVKGAIRCARKAKAGKIDVLGGYRLNFSMGFRFTFDFNARFHGMVDNDYKYNLMKKSKGLIFPVRWNEPFGLALTESLYCGCPVFGTPYGSLTELITPEVGFLSTNSDDLAEAMKNSDHWKAKECHDYAVENFNTRKMALKYIDIYQRVLDGEVLNPSAPVNTKKEPKLLHFS